MAGDWIKMRIDLQTHPKVFRIVSALKADRLRVIGGLHVAWSIFDTHSADGVLLGYDCNAMDAVIGWPGFTQAMIDVQWASIDEAGSLVMPRFDEHNGASAKQEDKGLRARFERSYEIILRRAQAGQQLDGKIATSIGHDSQKTEFELANELADQQVQAKILQQGIPADGKSARELLLAKFGKNNNQGAPQ